MTDDRASPWDLRGKAVLVTGASGGIGRSLALGFARAGAHVAVHYRRREAAAAEVCRLIRGAGGRAVMVGGDLTQPDGAAEVVHQAHDGLGRLDVLVNNAGDLIAKATLEEMNAELFHRIVDANLGSVLWASRAAVPHLAASQPSAIINVASIAARTGGLPGSLVYSAAKGAVATLTRGMAVELAPRGIRVNAVAPGTVLTDWHERYGTPEQVAARVARFPLGRGAHPDECVGPVLFLASQAMSSYVTGEVLYVAGGG